MLSSTFIFQVAVAAVISVFNYNNLQVSAFSGLSSTSGGVTVPQFYSEIVSPLAQISAHYASINQKVPVDLDMELPEHDSLALILKEQLDDQRARTNMNPVTMTATFAGGCFWGIQLAFDREPGVLATCVGYTQGNPDSKYPTYSAVCTEETGHTEACLVSFDPALVSYAHLAELMFDRVQDPTMLNRVGRDRGTQYRTGLYAHSEDQLLDAQTAFERENRTWFGREVVTEVKLAGPFWPAEEVHQRYLEKGGRFGRPQSPEKNSKDEIRCYG
mmetsp:Transcript_37206/g.43287  ORF Transcript_37206/g.43287 Transcript_37206/m.43287 type:complete len:273 (-) Transcript_37206:393-1211(-)|eukprot:CAMPEP_0194378894 /NCGR_PEP_ID=MMETSP0174-20130528/37172_1 /TAXON_ID=216777 /ORGANISM="Proboscia alata, Strain PI-D3" /LENGTH=272 /DNA_ID=CAMNT_0039161213 /DNA_START=132 /DNA_END=950 /DNA_ORIENTATION=-